MRTERRAEGLARHMGIPLYVYANPEKTPGHPYLIAAADPGPETPCAVVHPDGRVERRAASGGAA